MPGYIFRSLFAWCECHAAAVERFRCAWCGNALSIPVRRVELPAQPHSSLLDHHHINPPLLDPGTFAIAGAEYGRDRVVGAFVLSPGDVRGTRIVYDLVGTGCWSLVGWDPCVACESCGAVVAFRTDDCNVAQETRFNPSRVVRETCGDRDDYARDPFALISHWDGEASQVRQYGWAPHPARARPELTATRWRTRGLKAELYRDDPPA